MRRLTEDELRSIGDVLGAGEATDLESVVAIQERDDSSTAATVSSLATTLTMLTLALVCVPAFERRSRAVAVSAAAVLAGLNGHILDLEPSEEVAAEIATAAAGDADGLHTWFRQRLTPAPSASGPRCPGCGMPLRECLAVALVGRVLTPHCGGCGHLLARPARDPRRLQEA